MCSDGLHFYSALHSPVPHASCSALPPHAAPALPPPLFVDCTVGGAGFTVSSLLGCWEATGSWWRGLAPTRRSDLRSISWQVQWEL